MANAKISELPVLQKLGNTGAAPSASRNWDFAYTWNSGGTTFCQDFVNITDTASAAASLLIDRQVGGASKFKVSKAGDLTIAASCVFSHAGGEQFLLSKSTGEKLLFVGNAGAVVVNSHMYGWAASATDPVAAHDTAFARKAAGVSEANNGTKGSYTGSAFGAGSQTVAQLPAAATAGAGARSCVTDATATTFLSTVAGGGANIVPVMSNGTNWVIG